jgi:hypothetical protein
MLPAGLSSLSTSCASKEICGAEECVRFTAGDRLVVWFEDENESCNAEVCGIMF